MNLIDFEKSQDKSVIQAEQAIEESMAKYNLGRLTVRVIEIIKDMWETIDFKADGMDLTCHKSGAGSCQLAIKDSQLELLTSSDLNDLCVAINTDFDSTSLRDWASIDAMVREEGIWIEIEVLHPITQAEQFYKFWQDVSAKGAKGEQYEDHRK